MMPAKVTQLGRVIRGTAGGGAMRAARFEYLR